MCRDPAFLHAFAGHFVAQSAFMQSHAACSRSQHASHGRLTLYNMQSINEAS